MTGGKSPTALYISMIEEGAHPRHPGFLMLNSSTRYDDRRYNKGDAWSRLGACYEDTTATSRHGDFGEPTRSQKRSRDRLRRNSALLRVDQPPYAHRRTFPGSATGLLKPAIRALTAPNASVMALAWLRRETASA